MVARGDSLAAKSNNDDESSVMFCRASPFLAMLSSAVAELPKPQMHYALPLSLYNKECATALHHESFLADDGGFAASDDGSTATGNRTSSSCYGMLHCYFLSGKAKKISLNVCNSTNNGFGRFTAKEDAGFLAREHEFTVYQGLLAHNDRLAPAVFSKPKGFLAIPKLKLKPKQVLIDIAESPIPAFSHLSTNDSKAAQKALCLCKQKMIA